MPTNKTPRRVNVAAKPAKAAVAKAAAAARAVVTKPAAAKPATPAPAATPAVAKPARGVTRTAATIVANATNFGHLSDRDTAYISFYAGFAKRNGGTVTVAMLAATDTKPAYAGSAKPHDAGVVNRLRKAGLLNVSADGHSFTFTKQAESLAAYSSVKA